MTTYTVTINGETYREVTAATLKTMKKNNKNVKAVKNAATKSYYYRGEVVTYIEERMLGWTLVFNAATGKNVYAVTAELEYR